MTELGYSVCEEAQFTPEIDDSKCGNEGLRDIIMPF